MKRDVHGQDVFGSAVDRESRCAHYRSNLDIIAIRFKCCGIWFPCYECHAETADHTAQVWPANERDEKAILCGACGEVLTIADYMASGNACPRCAQKFNPGCVKHYHLYFE